MRLLLAALGILGAVIAQTMLTRIWPAASRFFDLPLIPVLYYAISRGPSGALLAGTGAGLLQDALEATLLGINALSKALVGYLVGILGLRFALVPLISRIIVIAAATIMSRSVEVATLAIMGRRLAYAPYPHLFESVPGNCLLGVLIIGALNREGSRETL
jgi:rod shape-determining protein MreD